MNIFKFLLISLLLSSFFVVQLWAGENTVYQKKIVKNRAKLYEDTEGRSPASHDLYIYADDKDIQNDLDDIRSSNGQNSGKSVNVVSPIIGVKSHVRNVNIVVDAKKGINIDRRKLGLKKDQDINIASPVIEKGARVRDVNITIDAKRGGIDIK